MVISAENVACCCVQGLPEGANGQLHAQEDADWYRLARLGCDFPVFLGPTSESLSVRGEYPCPRTQIGSLSISFPVTLLIGTPKRYVKRLIEKVYLASLQG